MFRLRKKTLRLNLALQGGGAHGAFTWGVLDRLLDEADIEIGWISGTSAGAINAVALAAGIADGGRAGGRARLRAVWESVVESGVPDLLRLNPFLASLSRSQTMGQIGSMFSPYDFNPINFDPLRKLLETHIDFAKLRKVKGPELLIAATDVATGRVRRFRRHELTIEAVLASTCLPQVHHAVEIDGRAYWDGGFSANPDLVTVAAESPIGDTLLVLLNPIEKFGTPRSTRDIASEVNRVTFSQPLLRDIAEITEAQAEKRGLWPRRATRRTRIAAHRFHMIEAGRHTAMLAPETKMRPDREMIEQLRTAGQDDAKRWFGRHIGDIGHRSSVDFNAQFFGPMEPLQSAADQGANDAGLRAAEEVAEKL